MATLIDMSSGSCLKTPLTLFWNGCVTTPVIFVVVASESHHGLLARGEMLAALLLSIARGSHDQIGARQKS